MPKDGPKNYPIDGPNLCQESVYGDNYYPIPEGVIKSVEKSELNESCNGSKLPNNDSNQAN